MTLGSATSWANIVYAGEAFHPRTHRYIHILGFQNRVINDSPQPNAVILPVPAAGPLGPENLLPMSRDALSFMASTLQQMDPNRGLLLPRAVRGAQQVTRGRYAAAVVNDPAKFVQAIEVLPEALRPPRDRAVLAAFARWYPGWPLLFACWQGRMQSDPVLLWYEPREPQRLFLPTLDAPTGGIPEPLRTVARDHTLIVGSTVHPFGVSVRKVMSVDLQPFLPTSVWGSLLAGDKPNVDHEVDVAPLHRLENVAGKHDLHARLDPKVWGVKFREVNPSRREEA